MMKNRVKFFLNLAFILVIFNSCENNPSELVYINLYITTVKSISCNELLKISNKKSRMLSRSEVGELLKHFSELKPAESDWNVDSRVSGFVDNDSEKTEFCMSATIIEINGKKYFVNDDLRNYILELTK